MPLESWTDRKILPTAPMALCSTILKRGMLKHHEGRIGGSIYRAPPRFADGFHSVPVSVFRRRNEGMPPSMDIHHLQDCFSVSLQSHDTRSVAFAGDPSYIDERQL